MLTRPPSPRSPAETIPVELWERIVFHVLTGKFYGPPSGIIVLSSVCSWMNGVVAHNLRLHARLFRFQFDVSAPIRRGLLTNDIAGRLKIELIKRWCCLKRIQKRGDVTEEDLWTCYLMMSENDGKNSAQLMYWAKLRDYVLVYYTQLLNSHTLYGTPGEALALWLLWMTTTRARLCSEHEEGDIFEVLDFFLKPYIAHGYNFSNFHAQDGRCSIPIPSDASFRSPSGALPNETSVNHFGRQLNISYPCKAPAATLTFIAKNEYQQSLGIIPNAPQIRAQNYHGPLVSDLVNYFYVHHTTLPSQGPLIIDGRYHFPSDVQNDDEDVADYEQSEVKCSRQYDLDWRRLLSCGDPSRSLSGSCDPLYEFGSICGQWAGRLIMKDHFAPRNTPTSQSLITHPFYATFHEFHCLEPDIPLSFGSDDFGGEDILNAWLPRKAKIQSSEECLYIHDPVTNRSTRYWLYDPNKESHYPFAAYSKGKPPLCSQPIAGGSVSSGLTATRHDLTHANVKVSDIIVTGMVERQHGEAWGFFNYLGRIRLWDGLVALRRTPALLQDSETPWNASWVFRGNIYDRKLVGRWRDTRSPLDHQFPGDEGGFVAYKLTT